MSDQLVFATYVEPGFGNEDGARLIESIRAFGGRFSDCPVWVYMPRGSEPAESGLGGADAPGVELRFTETPEEAHWVFYSGKVYAAAEAERAAADSGAILAWMDADTIMLSEPHAFALAPAVCLAYCPVMHNRSGVLYGVEPNAYWKAIYRVLGVSEDRLFPMVTPADRQTIRAYFHVGLLVVRPERGILRHWPRDFEKLYRDPELARMCREDRTQRVFLHQTAMVGSVLDRVDRSEMVELDDRYNYPVFFERGYDAVQSFDSIEGVVTLRCVISPEQAGADWHRRLRGPADRIAWLRERLFRS